MTERTREKSNSLRHSLAYAAVWLALMLLLAASTSTAYLDLGKGALPLRLGIAAVQVGLIFLFFMRLTKSEATLRLSAASALLWLSFLFALCLSDYFTRDWNGAVTPFSDRNAKVVGPAP